MKKFKTYGKVKCKKDMNSDDWDDIKETKNDCTMYSKKKIEWDGIKEAPENKTSDVPVTPDLEEKAAENPHNDSSIIVLKKKTVKPPSRNEVCNLFKNLSIHDHSTPIFSSSAGKEVKSNCTTPLKPDSAKRSTRLSSSEYSFTCKRSISFLSSTRKSYGRKTPCNYSNCLVRNNNGHLPDSPLFSSSRKISFKDALTISATYSEAEKKLLILCDQDEILSLEDVIGSSLIKKIGEGSYGEVFLKESQLESNAVKVVPVGDLEGQIRLNEIIPEMAISKKLSSWRTTKADNELYQENCVQGFIQLKKLQFCKGRFPKPVIKLWEEWKTGSNNDCQNDHPGIYTEDQLYVIFENKFGGVDLEKFKLKTLKEAVSILKQLVATLASAECSLQFEHRDLHWGNILIGKTDVEKIFYLLVDNQEYSIQSQGLTVSIIDFTLARLVSEDCVVFTDLSEEEELFEGSGDEQFDMYREMKKHNQNEWESFHPYTNVLWIYYITNKLISKLRTIVTLKKFASRILQYKSAYELLTNDEFLRNK